ncbi:MAG: hypothetical protein IKK26_05595 [Clostridia bacterium]|nr:hypothetical protein [Clostridia bacterium]
MTLDRSKICLLNGNTLKIIAAVAMLLDHIGYLFFPKIMIFRIIGRIAFPIFAFMIAEGCRYTKSKVKYFLTMTVLGLLIQLVYYFYSKKATFTVIITFSISILLIYGLQSVKAIILDSKSKLFEKLLVVELFAMSVVAVYVLNQIVSIEYGFYGCLLPVAASLLHKPANISDSIFEKLDKIPVHVAVMGVCLALMSVQRGWVQPYSLLSLPLLLLYSGKRGKTNMKYFFYIFYPAHLAVLEGVRMLLESVK